MKGRNIPVSPLPHVRGQYKHIEPHRLSRTLDGVVALLDDVKWDE
jgi:hypothetical protein